MIANSTPLIYLAKLGKLDLLKDFFKKIYVPEAVKREVVDQGKELYEPDALIIEQAINEGWIVVKNVTALELLKHAGIDLGELEAISLAVKMKCNDVLLDQTHARIAAGLVGLKPKGTIFVLLKALKKNKIDYEEYLSLLESLINVGFRMSEEVYLNAVKLGKEMIST